MRTPLVAGNWKMNKLVGEAVETANQLERLLADTDGVDIVVCPPFTALHAVGKTLAGSFLQLGAQDCYIKGSGAYTGEVSPQMLLDVGCTWTIVGHSERRQYFHETDELLNAKLRFALESGLKVIFCIGETLQERQTGRMCDVLARQVRKGLEGLQEKDFVRTAIAYEPVWAIGTGITATPEQAEEAHAFVRELIEKEFGETVAQSVRIQYGGSVTPENIKGLMAQQNIDGALVGGASLKAETFSKIVRFKEM